MEKTRIYVPISIGELIDKLTILEIKLQHIFDDTKYRNIQNEYMLLLNVAYNYKLSLDETPLSSWKQELRTVNLNIWNAEEQLKDENQKVNELITTNQTFITAISTKNNPPIEERISLKSTLIATNITEIEKEINKTSFI